MWSRNKTASENRIDNFWSKVFEMKILLGLPKFLTLSLFVKIGLMFAQGNTDVEGVFSENKLILNSKRTNMINATLNAYKATKLIMLIPHDEI